MKNYLKKLIPTIKYNNFINKMHRICPNLFNNYKQINKNTKIIIIVTLIFALLYMIFLRNIFLIDGYKIKRDMVGGEDIKYHLKVKTDKGKYEDIEFLVSAKRWTKKEAEEYFDKLFDSIYENILGRNNDFQHINKKLNIKPNYNNVKAIWNFEVDNREYKNIVKYNNLIEQNGEINNKLFEEDEEVSGVLSVVFKTKINNSDINLVSSRYEININIIKNNEVSTLDYKNEIKKEIDKQNKENLNDDELLLPNSINDKRIIYKQNFDFTVIYILILGVLASFLINYNDIYKKKKEEEIIKKQIVYDFPKILSKLLIYVITGMSIRNAFYKISLDYNNKKKKDNQIRKAYEEINVLATKIQSGYNEISAYEECSKEINQRDYTRFFNILIQNIKNGNKDLKDILNMEVYDAFEERKRTAKKLAEEASTKLILPLMMMLFIIMVVMIVPALSNM